MNTQPRQRVNDVGLMAPLAAALLIVLLAAITISGDWPALRQMVRFSGRGLVAGEPLDVTQVEIRAGQDSVGFRRVAAGWTIHGMSGAVPAELASHIDTGLRFLHVSEPVREIASAELTPASFAEFGLDPPASVVSVGAAQREVTTVNFGVLNPVGTSQYVRIGGSPTVYLMPRHVGSEWQVAVDMARRFRAQAEPEVAQRGRSLLLPVSMAQIWAVEIVAAGKLTRFERDSTGNWFQHIGQHSHSANANVHVADPTQARLIAAALESLDATAVETRAGRAADAGQLAKFGLAYPPVVVLLYARDNSTEVVRVEFGGPSDSLDRYARLAPHGEVVTVAEFEVKRLTNLLDAVGVGR